MVLWQFTHRFIQERKILLNVSPATLQWYKYSLQAFRQVLERDTTTNELKGLIIARIGELQTEKRGNKAVSINTYLRCLMTFFKWCNDEQILKEPVKLSWLKEEQKVLVTPTVEQMGRIIKWVPATGTERRLKAIILTLVDTGIRIDECLSLRPLDVDLENLVLAVRGKGNKHRLVPFSQELRKVIYKFCLAKGPYVFAAASSNKLSQRNLLREFHDLQERLAITGFRFSPHTFRHFFAVNFLRHGGDIYKLSRILGHSSIMTTQVYLRSLGIEDLQQAHSQTSFLSRSGGLR